MESRLSQDEFNRLSERCHLIKIEDPPVVNEICTRRGRHTQSYLFIPSKEKSIQKRLRVITDRVQSVLNRSVCFLLSPFEKSSILRYDKMKQFFVLSKDEIESVSTVFRYKCITPNPNQMRNELNQEDFNRELGQEKLIQIHDLPEGDHGCTVCRVDFRTNDRLRKLKSCAHSFHIACIDRVLREESRHCPTCQVPVYEHFKADVCLLSD